MPSPNEIPMSPMVCQVEVAYIDGNGTDGGLCRHCGEFNGVGITPKIVAALHKARVWDFTHAGEAE